MRRGLVTQVGCYIHMGVTEFVKIGEFTIFRFKDWSRLLMARFGCRCGETLWNGRTPNDIQLYVFTDRQMDKILESNSMETLDVSGE